MLILIIALGNQFASSQVIHTVPIESKNNRTYLSIRIGEMVIHDILLDTGFAFDGLILFNPAEIRSKQDNADAILGNVSLKRFNLILDYQNNKLYLKPNSHFSDLNF